MSGLLSPPADAIRLLQDYLDHSIPLVSQMQVRVEEYSADVLALSAPLAPNRNHIGTVFGGSLNGLATLACWGAVWLLLHGRNAHIVIHEGNMKFSRPATDTFHARCALPAREAAEDFVNRYLHKGRARIALTADVTCNGERVAEFSGSFAALDAAKHGNGNGTR